MSRHFLRIAVTVGFVAVVAAFHLIHPYRLLFFSHEQGALLLYSLGRVIFCAYYLAILFSLGNLVLSLVTKPVIALGLSPLEEIAISVLCGSAGLRLAMLLLGFAGLYQLLLLGVVGVLFVWLGTPRLWELIRLVASAVRQAGVLPHADRWALVACSLALLVACATVVTTKFLFPNGTGDYFSHYLPYFQAVTSRGNIWPNEIWYQFFLSKGAGDVFFAIILSDLLGPLTVSCAMFFSALAIMYCTLRRGSGDPVVALAGTAITASGFIWTVEGVIGFSHWAEFSKEHVTTAVLFFGCVWAIWRQKTIPPAAAHAWSYLTATIFVGLILMRVQFAAISLVLLFIVSGWEYAVGNKQDAKTRIIPAAAAFGTAIVLLAINYAATGLVEITPFRLFWRFADQEKFSQWVSPFLMLLLDLGSSPDLGSLSPPDLKQFPTFALLAAVFRLDRLSPYLWPFGIPLIAALSLTLVALWRKPEARQLLLSSHAGICGAMFAAAILVFFSVNQIGSLFRLYMFTMFPVVALASLPFAISRSLVSQSARTAIGLVVAALAFLAPIFEIDKIPSDARNLALRYLVGDANVADAYTSQNAVWPAALEMSAVTEPGSPIWLSQVGWHFCVAPACNTQSFFSFSMGKQWPVIMFDSPSLAKAALQAEGLNYFAMDTASPFFDLLPYSPMFRPEAIGDYLGVLWTDGTVYLLTWRSARTTPLPPEFYGAYRKSIESATQFADFQQLYDRLAGVYEKWKAHPQWPVKLDETLPRIRGWQ